MIKILDRTLILSYVKSYVVCLVSLMSMFIVVDLFMNLDNFNEQQRGLGNLLSFIAMYYSAKSTVIFDRISEGIVLMAAMFTIAWMQRNNEILPLLSAGVSTRRVVLPVLVAAAGMVGIAVANQEFTLPNIDPYLVEYRGDSKGDRLLECKPGFESNGIHIIGSRAIKKGKDLIVYDFNVNFPAYGDFQGLPMLTAKEAKYCPPKTNGREFGGWELYGTTPPTVPSSNRKDNVLENPVPGKYFLRTNEIDFASVTRPKNWSVFVPTARLIDELNKIDHRKRSSVAVMFHARLTRPILSMLLVFMGLSIILRDQNRNVFISTGLSIGLCGTFFVTGFACRYLGDNNIVLPVVAAWLPVLIFGPLSFVMFDAVHT